MKAPVVQQVVRPESVPTTSTDFDPPLRSCRLCGGTDLRGYDVDYWLGNDNGGR